MNELEHYGTKGQEWGTRRFQYEDGSLTPEGKIRYGQGERKDVKKVLKQGLKEAKKNERKNAAVSRTLREMDKLEQKYSKLFGSF